jgi:hypothetical protein
MISIRDVLDADELFLTNSSWGVLPVVAVESHAVGGGHGRTDRHPPRRCMVAGGEGEMTTDPLARLGRERNR